MTLAEYKQMESERKAAYGQSRAAQRKEFGTRRIDASAPPSMADTTPSARERLNLLKYKGDPNAEAKADEATKYDFARQFQPRSMGLMAPASRAGRPMAWGNATPGTPEAIAQFQQTNSPMGGFTPGQFQVPQYKGTAEVSYPGQSITPPFKSELTPLSFNLGIPSSLSASVLAPYLPNNPGQSYTPPWRKTNPAGGGFMAGILQETSRWLV